MVTFEIISKSLQKLDDKNYKYLKDIRSYNCLYQIEAPKSFLSLIQINAWICKSQYGDKTDAIYVFVSFFRKCLTLLSFALPLHKIKLPTPKFTF